MLSTELIEQILAKLPSLSIGVVGDLFLDQYLHLDHRLTEPSIETGLDAYQVVKIVNSPGAAGTVLNNLVALGVGNVKVLSFIGTDGRGHDLKTELLEREVDPQFLLETPLRQTPAYTKPMLSQDAGPLRELNRLDIKNRTRTPGEVEKVLLESLPTLWAEVDALLVLDQVSEPNTGVITDVVRERISKMGEENPSKLLLADSRERIGLFRNCWTKPNLRECRQWAGASSNDYHAMAAVSLFEKTNRPVFCTLGAGGIMLVHRHFYQNRCMRMEAIEEMDVPAYPVPTPIDTVGAGDSTSAGIACAYAAGASLTQSAAFGNLVASITIQQLGTTGTASPEQVRGRWREVATSSLV